jgi:small subunit ribosomal protein S15
MAVPLTFEMVSKIATCKSFLSSLSFSRHCIKKNCTHLLKYAVHETQASIFTNKRIQACALSSSAGSSLPTNSNNKPDFKSKNILSAAVLSGMKHALPWHLASSRHYGRKVPQKPPKIEHFEYSGDLRKLPELEKTTILAKYKGLEPEIEGNEILKKLCSLEFATPGEYAEHRRYLIKERMLQLFGPDCELELQVALLTLRIRQMIPYCIKYRKDKGNKTHLVNLINHRKDLLTHLRETDHERFEWLLRELKIRYVIPRDPEPFKGWKHNLRVATKDEAASKQRQKLEELKVKFEAEKKVFFEHKAKVLAQIEEDLKQFGLDRSFLDKLLAEQKDASSKHELHNNQKVIASHEKKV